MIKPKSVLIVEDEQILRDVYELILKNEGHTVYAAKNGVEGLQQLRERKPDIMLLDIFMPEMDGREVLHNLSTSERSNTKIIVCSNLSDNAVIQEVLGNGADKFVLKSNLGPAELVELVKTTADE